MTNVDRALLFFFLGFMAAQLYFIAAAVRDMAS